MSAPTQVPLIMTPTQAVPVLPATVTSIQPMPVAIPEDVISVPKQKYLSLLSDLSNTQSEVQKLEQLLVQAKEQLRTHAAKSQDPQPSAQFEQAQRLVKEKDATIAALEKKLQAALATTRTLEKEKNALTEEKANLLNVVENLKEEINKNPESISQPEAQGFHTDINQLIALRDNAITRVASIRTAGVGYSKALATARELRQELNSVREREAKDKAEFRKVIVSLEKKIDELQGAARSHTTTDSSRNQLHSNH